MRTWDSGLPTQILTTLIVVAVTVVASALVSASPAAAQGSGELFWDDEATTFASFGPNESVTIAFGTIGFGCDAFFPTADVYVMASPPTLGDTLADLSGTPNTVFGATGGLFSDTIAFTKPTGALGAGTYTVVYDECQDGDLDSDDTVFADVFRVRELPTDVPPIDSSIQALKAGAGTTAERYSKLSAVIDSLEKAQELQEALECVTGPADCLVDAITGAVTDAIIEQIKLGLGLPTADPKVLARDVLADNIKHYKGIEADPPDPAFRVTTKLAPVETLHPEESTSRTLARFALANSQAQEGALAEALLRAIERYQGADVAGSGSWARAHAREARDLAGLLAAQLGVTNAALASLRGAIVDDPGDLDAVAADLSAALSDLRTSGIGADAEQELLNLGLDRAQISRAVAELLAEDDLSGFDQAVVLEAIDDAAAANTDLASALAATADDIDLVLTQLDADPTVPADAFPTADAGGPYAASMGSPITLAGAVSDPQGPVPSADWDLDRDGQFDDATGVAPTVTFDEAFDGLIGLRAADTDGHVTVAYASVVIDGGHPPTATFSPSGFMPAAPIGESTVFHTDASDQDGDAVEITWRLDGDQVRSGPDFSYTPTAADAGSHLLEASVTDGSTTILHFWALSAIFGDADGDGWTANVDCDDSSAARNPGLPETAGNGIDDDCSTFTIDDAPIGHVDLTLGSGTDLFAPRDFNTESSSDGGTTYGST